jgi:NADH-quinone oxidoreductase subunit E
MNATETSKTCITICWALSALAGLGLIIAVQDSVMVLFAVAIGVAVAVAGGALLQKLVCGADLDNWGPFEGLKGVPGWDAPGQKVAPAGAASPAAARPSPAPAPVAKADAPLVRSSQLAGEAELSARKGTCSYDGQMAGPADGSEGPARLAAPRAAGGDDLKLIKGVGPKLEGLLNAMGFFHYDQIATWTQADVAWMDDNLEGFKGRVSRDEWVEQANILAAGGETEFSKRNA